MVSANAIDISEFQDPSTFDYQAAKNAGVKTIIIRGSVSMRLDKHAKEHIANAKKYGFHWHLYHYYYGGSGEADYAIQAAQELGLSSSQYLFLDMEDKSLPNDWSASFEIFRKKAQSHFKVGLYCSDSPYKAKFNDSVLRQEHVARWVASYSYEPQSYDIWQMSGAGSGGFGSYNHDVDRDYDKTGLLTGSSSSDNPKTPTGPIRPGYRAIILEYGVDSETGVYGRGYSYDNGKTFYVTDTTYGRKYRQEDGDRIAPFLKKYFSPAGPVETSIKWVDILDKPDVSKFVTNNQLTSYYTKAEADSKLSGKADASALSAYAKSADLGSVRSTAESASSTAYSAQETARKAQNTAESAESRAESAYSLASTASSDVQATTQVPIITSGTLADLANNQGSYHYEIDFIPSDSPTYDWGLLDVVVGTNYAKQVFTNTNDADVYVRTRIYGSWSSWRQITLWN